MVGILIGVAVYGGSIALFWGLLKWMEDQVDRAGGEVLTNVHLEHLTPAAVTANHSESHEFKPAQLGRLHMILY
jgi:hypothetical protein